MKMIGGMFPLETAMEAENGFFTRMTPPEGDLVFMMSGRCGIYHCLRDFAARDRRKVAYVPIYTCETVLSSYVKTGYELEFYEVDRSLRCVFDPAVLDRISLVSLCGYYGFCAYDRDFLVKCRERGICILEDVTHSVFSADGIDPLSDYVAGSFRKWLGITCGGFAMKRCGKFAVDTLSVDPEHLALRKAAIETGGNDVFWEGEMLLRRMFDSYASDAESEYILRHADFDALIRRRRANYAAILSGLATTLNGLTPVFPALTPEAVPSHFVLYAEDRDDFRAFLSARDIRSTVYWPVGPQVSLEGHDTARYIYDHIVAIPCDQRFDAQDMARVAQALNAYGERA